MSYDGYSKSNCMTNLAHLLVFEAFPIHLFDVRYLLAFDAGDCSEKTLPALAVGLDVQLSSNGCSIYNTLHPHTIILSRTAR